MSPKQRNNRGGIKSVQQQSIPPPAPSISSTAPKPQPLSAPYDFSLLSDANRSAFVDALKQEYSHVTGSIGKFASLQYQLVGLAYTLIGAVITVLLATLSKDFPSTGLRTVELLVLLFPPIFSITTLIQIYLHSQIKLYGRYVLKELRPTMNELIAGDFNNFDYDSNIKPKLKKWNGTNDRKTIWGWEKYYASNQYWLYRLLGAAIVILPVLPGYGILSAYSYLPGLVSTNQSVLVQTVTPTFTPTLTATSTITPTASAIATSIPTAIVTPSSIAPSSNSSSQQNAVPSSIDTLIEILVVIDWTSVVLVTVLALLVGLDIDSKFQR